MLALPTFPILNNFYTPYGGQTNPGPNSNPVIMPQNNFYTPYGGTGAGSTIMPQNTGYYSPYGSGAPSVGGSSSASSALPNYNASPQPTSGQGAYGLVPGTIPIPPSAWQQTIDAAPGLGNTTQLTNNIMSELQGDINPQALKNMQDAAASYGVSSGMPGSNAIPGTLAFNKNLRNIGLDTLAVQRQGQQDYLSALQGIGGTQTPQGLAAEIAAHNAQLRAAPDPQAAAQQQLANYWAALNALRGPGGGTGQGLSPAGGTGQNAASALGFGGAAGVGNELGFGFGNFQNGSPVQANQGGTGTGYGGVPGQPGLAYNWETGEYQDTTPISSFGTPNVPFAPPNTNYNATTDQSVYDPFSQYGSYYDQSAAPDLSGSPYLDIGSFYG